MELHFKSKIDSYEDLLTDLVPFNVELKESSIEEYVKIEDKYYRLFKSSVASDQVLVHSFDVLDGLNRLVDFYDWTSCFHPLDMVQWQKVYDHFELGSFLESSVFSKNIQSQKSNLEKVSKVDLKLLNLLLKQKVDFRMIAFLESFGFKLNVFFEYLFEEGSFNFQMQKKIIENFGSFFRRNKTDVEEFLEENRECVQEKINNKSSFIQWMNELTRPSLINELKRRSSLLKQVDFAQHISLKLDETLEDAWINIQFQVEGMDEYDETIENLSMQDNKDKVRVFFEEC
ncbi:MAG: hypothetical protein KC646_02775 [Candidatus Cloacimonetes bacterium]|nr:hypothetical protein [Candidatus Cloacimonadota bacterium]